MPAACGAACTPRRARCRSLTSCRVAPRAQVVDVIHPGLAGVSKNDLKEKLAKMYTVRVRPLGLRARAPRSSPWHRPPPTLHRAPPPLTPVRLARLTWRSFAVCRSGVRPQLHPAVRLQGGVRWRAEHGLWHDLRQPGSGEEVRAQVPTHAVRHGEGQGCGPQAAQGAEEPCQEGSWHQEYVPPSNTTPALAQNAPAFRVLPASRVGPRPPGG